MLRVGRLIATWKKNTQVARVLEQVDEERSQVLAVTASLRQPLSLKPFHTVVLPPESELPGIV